jgi:hypothetical protein
VFVGPDPSLAHSSIFLLTNNHGVGDWVGMKKSQKMNITTKTEIRQQMATIIVIIMQ